MLLRRHGEADARAADAEFANGGFVRSLGLMSNAELRKEQFGDLLGLLQMRVAGGYDRLDAEVLIFAQSCSNRLRAADKRRARPAPHQADARPDFHST